MQQTYTRTELLDSRVPRYKSHIYIDCARLMLIHSLGILHKQRKRGCRGKRLTRTCTYVGYPQNGISVPKIVVLRPRSRRRHTHRPCRFLRGFRKVIHPPWHVHPHLVIPRTLQTLQFGLINSRSVRNKSLLINETILEKQVDVLGITETWLLESDSAVVSELAPHNYAVSHVPREGDLPYGGVALVYRDSLSCSLKKHGNFSTFEYIHAHLSSGALTLHVVVVYRPPPSSRNGHTIDRFITEFTELLESLNCSVLSDFIILGDFNFHMDCEADPSTRKFCDLHQAFSLKQLVTMPTHTNGHTLDLILVPDDSGLVGCEDVVVADWGISDHFAVSFPFRFEATQPIRKTIRFRKIKQINIESFCCDLQQSLESHCDHQGCSHSVDDALASMHECLQFTLEKHAPLREKRVIIRNHSPWIDDSIFEARRDRRRAERRVRDRPTAVCLREYRLARNKVVSLIAAAKRAYYNRLFEDSSNNPRTLFRSLNELLKPPPTKSQSASSSSACTASAFMKFFEEKVKRIRATIPALPQIPDPNNSNVNAATQQLKELRPVDESGVLKVFLQSRCTTSVTDPLPCSLLKACLPTIVGPLTRLLNLSLTSSTVPAQFKAATVRPLLKKSGLDSEELSNYRPISTLPFISKVLERIVLAQFLEHLQTEGLCDPFQSAYRTGYSTETAMVRVQNDILQSLDRKQNVILVLLDLSAAFDTIDHAILLRRMGSRAGITGSALDWVSSYLSDRKQRVLVDGQLSDYSAVRSGVPQGSVLGPVLFSLYLLPLGDLLKENGIAYHLYADDTQLYIAADPSDPEVSFAKVETIAVEISHWMSRNFLKLNQAKTEILLISSRQSRHPFFRLFNVGDENQVTPSNSVRDLGAFISADMTVGKHITAVCKTSYWTLRNLARVRKYLTDTATHAAARSLILSRLDFHNALLHQGPAYQLQRLQRVQNTAARLVVGAERRAPSRPILSSLHWLPIEARINYKVCIFAFRAIRKTGPSYLVELISEQKSTRLRSSSHGCTLVVQRTRTVTFGDRSFQVAAPRLWNSLPRTLRDCTDEKQFRRGLKTHLFKQFLAH